jgi:hypothetical protein
VTGVVEKSDAARFFQLLTKFDDCALHRPQSDICEQGYRETQLLQLARDLSSVINGVAQRSGRIVGIADDERKPRGRCVIFLGLRRLGSVGEGLYCRSPQAQREHNCQA